MNSITHDQRATWCAGFARATGTLAALAGLLVLVGWAFDISLLKSVLPGLVTMKANTALGFILSGVALILYAAENMRSQRRQVANGLAAAVTLIGLVTLLEYIFGWNPGLDQMLCREVPGAVFTSHPGRMSPITALDFLLLGTALLLLDRPRLQRVAQIFSMIAGLCAGLALAGYIYNFKPFFAIGTTTTIAVHTAALFMVLAAGVLLARGHDGWIARAMRNHASIGFGISLSLLLVVGAGSFHNTREQTKTAHWVTHSYRVIDCLTVLLSTMQDVETGGRGFVVTGDEHYLEPCVRGEAAIQGVLNEVRQLTADNPQQQARLKRLTPLIARKIDAVNRYVAQRREQSAGLAAQNAAFGAGKLPMDEIRLTVSEMIGAENDLLHQRQMEMEASNQNTLVALTAGTVVSAGLLIAVFIVLRREIAEHRRTEAERDRGRAQLKFIFDTVPVGISFTLTEPDGRMTNQINDTHLRICGLTRKQAAEYGIFKKITEPEDQQRQMPFTRQIESGEIDNYSMDKRYVQPDGQSVWVLFSFQRRRYPDGRHEDLSTVVDITGRKQMEATLRRSEENLSVTLQSIGDAVLATDAAGRVTRMNPVAEKLTGWTEAEALGRSVTEVFHIINEQTREPAVIPVDKVLATGEIHGLANHTVIIARDGTERPIADSAAPIRNKDGNILGVVLVFRDVTEEKLAERAIRESEVRYRTLFDSIDEGYCIIEMIFDGQDKPVDYRFLEINPSFEKQTGLRDALGKRMRELAPTLEAHWFEIYGRIALTGEPARFQNRAEQLHRWFDVYAFRFGEPKQRQVAVLFNDITQRKQTEDALVRSEENLAVTLQSIGDAVLATDAAGRVTRLNPVAEKLTGWTEAEAQGRPVAEVFNIINESTRQPTVIPVDKVLATGAIQGLANHTVVIARNGAEHPIADSAAPIRDKAGKIIGVVLVFRDVAAERAVELSLLESERRLRALNEELEQRVAQRAAELQESERLGRAALDALAAHVAVLDEHGTILATNQAWQLFASQNGLSPEQAGAGVNYLTACTPEAGPTPESAAKIAHAIGEVIAGRKREITVEYDCHSPKEKRWFLCRVTRFAGSGPIRVVVAHENITHMKELERQQFRAQRMESLGTLAGGVAHDLNNALAPILMGVELLKEEYPKATEMITMVENSAKRGADMVRQLLTFARGAEGKRASLQVRHLVREIEKIIAGTFPKNIQVETKCAPDMPPVQGDATQLHQVILNLCVNARDAMPTGGVITIAAQLLEVDAVYASTVPEASPGQYLRLQISDTGTGIPPEIIDRIFDPFFTTKSPDKGTGLGLSNVLGIVKGHGGFIKVYSQPGQGSTFAIHLPADTKTADTEHLARPTGSFRGRGEIILFVDDEPAVRDVAQAVLKHLNFRPLTASDGSEGLLEAMDHRTEISAIIADLHMPHMDGLAFVRALRRVLPDIPVIMASGRMDNKVRDELLTLNVKTFLDKPFTEMQLAAVLQEILTQT